jgi:hypothetical protein
LAVSTTLLLALTAGCINADDAPSHDRPDSASLPALAADRAASLLPTPTDLTGFHVVDATAAAPEICRPGLDHPGQAANRLERTTPFRAVTSRIQVYADETAAWSAVAAEVRDGPADARLCGAGPVGVLHVREHGEYHLGDWVGYRRDLEGPAGTPMLREIVLQRGNTVLAVTDTTGGAVDGERSTTALVGVLCGRISDAMTVAQRVGDPPQRHISVAFSGATADEARGALIRRADIPDASRESAVNVTFAVCPGDTPKPTKTPLWTNMVLVDGTVPRAITSAAATFETTEAAAKAFADARHAAACVGTRDWDDGPWTGYRTDLPAASVILEQRANVVIMVVVACDELGLPLGDEAERLIAVMIDRVEQPA